MTGTVKAAERESRHRRHCKGKDMDENEHPKGALLFILVYLLLLAALWTNAYLRLWKGWGA
jgi:hypothetical protein